MPELYKTVLFNSSNLKAYYRFEGNSTDSSASGLNGTDTTVTYGAAKFGNGASLGASSRIVLPSAVVGGSPVSIVFWLKPANNGADGYVITDYDPSSSTGIGILLNSSEQIGVGVNGGVNTIQSAALSTAEFSHVAIIVNGASSAIYINGKATTGTLAAMTNNTNKVRLNGRWTAADSGDAVQTVFEIDDLAFYDTALSADQIKELYEGRYLGELRPNQFGTTVGLWHLNGNSTDSSGNNSVATDTAITYSQANGKLGQGAGFNGTSSAIALANLAIFRFSGNYTVGCWIKTSTKSRTIYANLQGGLGPVQGMSLSIDASGYVSTYSGETSSATATGNKDVTDGVWHHVACRYDGSTLKVFVDGAENGSAAKSISPNWYAPDMYVRIGCSNILGSNNSFFSGSMDEFFMCSTALTANQIRQIYALGVGKYY